MSLNKTPLQHIAHCGRSAAQRRCGGLLCRVRSHRSGSLQKPVRRNELQRGLVGVVACLNVSAIVEGLETAASTVVPLRARQTGDEHRALPVWRLNRLPVRRCRSLTTHNPRRFAVSTPSAIFTCDRFAHRAVLRKRFPTHAQVFLLRRVAVGHESREAKTADAPGTFVSAMRDAAAGAGFREGEGLFSLRQQADDHGFQCIVFSP